MKKYIILSILIVTVFCNINGQGLTEHKFRINSEPLYFATNGLKLSLDFRLKNAKNWLVISPIFYYKDNSDIQYVSESDIYFSGQNMITTKNVSKVKGIGLTIEERISLTTPTFNKSIGYQFLPYFSYGAMFTKFNISYLKEDWYEVPVDNIPYLQWGVGEQKLDISKAGLNFALGVQTELIEDLIVDFYLGCGIRYSFYDGEKKFNKSSMDYGFTGVMLLGGIKVGVGF